jgi:lysocardiolipin and lysophospholipid acyltransferase
MIAPSRTKGSRKLWPANPVTQHRNCRLTDECSRGGFGEEYFGLVSTYFQGRPPKSVNFHWRRFRLSDIPLDDQKSFDLWLREEWYKKDALMEEYMTTGRFPRMEGGKVDYIETEVKTRQPWEILQLFTVVGTAALIWHNIKKSFTTMTTVFQ